jgi:hypothetical protein
VRWANLDYFAKLCGPTPGNVSAVPGYSKSRMPVATGFFYPLRGVEAAMARVGEHFVALIGIHAVAALQQQLPPG